MAVTAAEVRAHVGAAASDDAAIEKLLTVATTLVDGYVEDAVVDSAVEIPEHIIDRAHLLVTAELWAIDQAPNGILNQQFESDDGIQNVPVRISADALRPIYPLLSQWVLPVIA